MTLINAIMISMFMMVALKINQLVDRIQKLEKENDNERL